MSTGFRRLVACLTATATMTTALIVGSALGPHPAPAQATTPAITAPSSVTIVGGSPQAIAGISVSGTTGAIRLRASVNPDKALSVVAGSGASVSGSGGDLLVIDGDQTAVNATIATLTLTTSSEVTFVALQLYDGPTLLTQRQLTVDAQLAPFPPTLVPVQGIDGGVQIGVNQTSNRGSTPSNLEYSVDGGAWTPRSPASLNPLLPIAGLTSGVSYQIRARVDSNLGPSDASLPLTMIAGVRPGAPTQVAGSLDGSVLTITWQPPALLTGSYDPPAYHVEATPGPLTSPSCSQPGPSARSCVISGVPAGVTPSVRVGSQGATSSEVTWSTAVAASVVVAPTPSGPGGATSPREPSAEPTAVPVPVPSPAPSAAAPSPALDPVTLGASPLLPATGLRAGGAVLIVNGSAVPISITPSSDPGNSAVRTGLRVAGPSLVPPLLMTLEGLGAEAAPLGLTPSGALVFQSRRSLSSRMGDRRTSDPTRPVVRTQGNGFARNSEVRLYLLPDTLLGSVSTDAVGSFSGDVPVPNGIAPGVHTLQANGFAPDGSVRSLSLGVVVTSQVPDGRAASSAISATVAFAPRSARLTPRAQAVLRRLASRAQDTAGVVRVRGFVQRSSDSANDVPLSRARAQAVARYLRSLGLRADYRVTGAGAASATAEGRRADVVISRSWA